MLKKHSVVMLPTNEKANKATLRLNPSTNKIDVCQSIYKQKDYLDIGFKCYELYFLSDEKIKEGDWYINLGTNYITKCEVTSAIFTEDRKIIATTDSSLKVSSWEPYHEHPQISLPQPSQSFIEKYIEKYNKGEQIKEVMVDYEIGNWEHYNEDQRRCVNCNTINHKVAPYKCECIGLKINSKDNTITIKPVKDSWSREEAFLVWLGSKNLYLREETPQIKQERILFNKWIEENL